MKDTYRNLIHTARLMNKKEKEMIQDYKKGKNESEIVAKIFCSNFGYFFDSARKYKSVDSDDKASYALQSIHEVLQDFDEDRNVKFMGLVILYFERKLNKEIEYQNYKKRKDYVDSLDRIKEIVQKGESTDIKCSKVVNKEGGLKNFNYSKIKNNLEKTDKLTKKQKKIIKHLLDSNRGGIESISSDLNMTDDEIEEEMKKIKNKNIYEVIS